MDFDLIQWLIIFVSHFLLLAVLVYQICPFGMVITVQNRPTDNAFFKKDIEECCLFRSGSGGMLIDWWGFHVFVKIICLSDLEADYMNPYESAEKINAIVVPEFIVQGLVCVVFLICGRWIMFLLSLPLACYHLSLYLKREHLLDVTEIFRALSREKKLRFQKLGVYLFFFFITIVRELFRAEPSHDKSCRTELLWRELKV
ncbi:cornichon homolog 1-like protein [Drosera capensis]